MQAEGFLFNPHICVVHTNTCEFLFYIPFHLLRISNILFTSSQVKINYNCFMQKINRYVKADRILVMYMSTEYNREMLWH